MVAGNGRLGGPARGLACLGIAALLLGCVAGTGSPSREAADATSLRALHAFAPVETDVTIQYYGQGPLGPAVDTGNMNASLWEIHIPTDARLVRATAQWTPSVTISPAQELMFHAGTSQRVGALVGTMERGASPLATLWTPIPVGTTTLVVMCHVYGSVDQPVAVEFDQTTHLRVEFE